MSDSAPTAAHSVADGEFAAALALDRRIYVRAGQEQIELPRGWVVRHHDLSEVYFLNYLRLAAPLDAGLDATAVAELACRWQHGLGHRRVVIEDVEAGERLAGELTERGWERSRTVFMILRSDPAGARRDPRAREISEEELGALQLATNEEEDFGPHSSPGLPQRLADAQAVLRAATPARGFGAGVGGALQSMCTLFLEPDVGGRRAAMVEQVGTLRAFRQRGLAKATVSAALLAAAEWGAQLIVVPADADDWPQLLYAGLGFAAVGRIVSLTLRAGSVSGAV
ncbi:MAG: hypothetical protein ACLPZR_08760 [Solirubrobacteraceae bacterium]